MDLKNIIWVINYQVTHPHPTYLMDEEVIVYEM